MNKNNLVPGTIKGIQIVDLEKKIHNKSTSKNSAIKLNKSKNLNNFNNSINNDSSSLICPKENYSNKNASISSKTKPQHISISSNQNNNNNKNVKIKGNTLSKNNNKNFVKIKSNPKNNNLPKPTNTKQKEIIIYKEKKIVKKQLSFSKNKKPNTQGSILRNINNSNYSQKQEKSSIKLKSEENEKHCQFFNDNNDDNFFNDDSYINNNIKKKIYNNKNKRKIKVVFKRILSMNTDMDQTSFIKSSIPTSNLELNSSLDSINFHQKKRERKIRSRRKNLKKSIKKSVTNNRTYIISKDKSERKKILNNNHKIKNRSNQRLNKIIKKNNINHTSYNSNNNNNSINNNNNSLYLKENINNGKLNNSNSLGAVNNNHKNHSIENMSNIKNDNNILNRIIINNNKMNNTFNNNNHRLSSSSKSKNKSKISENKIIIRNKRNDYSKTKQKNKLNNYINYANKIINKKGQKLTNKSPTKNKQINIIMIHSNAKNNINQNIIVTSSNYNKEREKEKEKENILSSGINTKKEMIKKIRINNYKNISSQKKRKTSHYNVNNKANINNINNNNVNNANNINNNANNNNYNMKGSANTNKYKIIKKIKNNYVNNGNNKKIINLKGNVKLKTCNLLNEVNNKINNSQTASIKKSCSNNNYIEIIKDSVSPKSINYNKDMNKINNDSKVLTSNNSCEELPFNKIISIQKIKINKNNNNNCKIYDIINNEILEISSKNKKRKRIDESFNNNKNMTTNNNKSFNIGNNINYNNNNNNINSLNTNNNNNNDLSNKTLNIYEKIKRPKKIISISCSLKNPQNIKSKIKVHRRHQSVINQCPNSNKAKKNGYQSLNNNMNNSLRSKINPQIINIDLQNESYIKNRNKIRNNTKKFFNKEEPTAACKIISKYKKYLKEFEIEELKQISKKGELVYYLGEIIERINNKEKTFSKINQSFILSNKNSINKNEKISLKIKDRIIEEKEKNFFNRSSNNFYKGKDENLKRIKNKFDSNNFNDEEGDYIINNGTHLNYRYEIIECLGKGSFGEAIKCYDHKNKDLVCIKIINSQKKFQKQALTEIKILSEISTYDINNDTNNVKFYNYFIFRGHICLVFELLGKNLYEYLQLNNFIGLDISQIKNYTTQILFSLLFLRNMNIIHCDLKPENILIFPKNPNQIKVIDFGSSCFENERLYLYIQSRFYRAPEVILDLGYSYNIDIWSLGCILFELYTGTPLFPGINEMEQIYLIMEKIGMPPLFLIEKTPKGRLFFDNNLRPFILKNEEGNIIKPGGKKIKDLLKDAPDTFIDFINKCLLWNPLKRLTPDKALFHPFIIENMSSPELYKHKLKVKHIKYGMQYNINSTRNKDFYHYNYNRENTKYRDNSCETNSNINKIPFKMNNNERIYTNTVYGEKEEIKKVTEENYSITYGNKRHYNIFNKKKHKNLPLSIDVDINLRRINTTENNGLNYRKISNIKKTKKKLPRHLPKKKSLGRNKNNSKLIKNSCK